MDPDLVRKLAAFLFLLAGVGVGLRLFLPMIAQHFKGNGGGWGELAAVYKTNRAPPTSLSRRHSFVVGHVLYRNCVSVASDPVGFYLELGQPLSWFEKRPLFIPWTEFKSVEPGRLFWRIATVLWVGAPRIGSITVPMVFFNAVIRPHLSAQAQIGESTLR
jgi:hypothetical protein